MGFISNDKALPELRLKHLDPYSTMHHTQNDRDSYMRLPSQRGASKGSDTVLTSHEHQEALGFLRKQITSIKEFSRKQNAFKSVPAAIQALRDQQSKSFDAQDGSTMSNTLDAKHKMGSSKKSLKKNLSRDSY